MFRLIFFAPYVLAEAITAVICLLILQPDGLVDQTCQAAGLGGLVELWLADLDVVFYTMFVVITWKYIGFAIILFLAGLQGVPRELQEAAAIDGAIALASVPLRHAAAARADDPDLGVPGDHRVDPALRPDLDHDPRRACRRVQHDGDVHDRPRLQPLPDRLRQRYRRDPVRDLPSSSRSPTSASCCAGTRAAAWRGWRDGRG